MMKRVFSFEGRVDRTTYALYLLISYPLIYVFGVLFNVAAHSLDQTYPVTYIPAYAKYVHLENPFATGAAVISLVMVITTFIASLSFLVRRFHDINISGWFVLLWGVIFGLVPDVDWSVYLPPVGTMILTR